jgi:hypothetical protein
MAPAFADPAGDAAATLSLSSIYVSTAAQSLGFEVPAGPGTVGTAPRIAVFAEDEVDNAGKLAAQLKSELGSVTPTVGIVLVDTSGVADFHAVSDSTSFCKGGADYAAGEVLDDVVGTRPDTQALLAEFTTKLSDLPPDKGESSCASALAHHKSHDLTAWLWMAAAAVVGVAGIGAFAAFVRRTVRARGVEPVRENLPEWLTDADAEDGDDAAGDDAAGDDDEQR